MAPQNEHLQKICVPRVTVTDLCHWLSHAPASHTISHVTLHVGVNSCPNGLVSEAAWSDLIAMCRKLFSQASLRLSSIMPARGRNNLNNAIVPSNRHLQTACSEAGVEFVDNQSTFTAESGAPRLSLYKDIHPSAKGTARLAANLRYTDSTKHLVTAITSISRGYVQTTASFKNATSANRNRMAMTSRGSKVTVVCNDIATTFSGTTRTSSSDVTTAATDTGMPTINDDPDTCTAARTIHTAHRIITVINRVCQ